MRGRGRPKNVDYYALYKGDELVGIGTRDELAEMLGVKRRTIYYASTPTAFKRNKGKMLLAYKLEDEE